ncbi:MAG: chorismate-binding protein [Sphingobacteriales bacterium]
MRVFKTFPVSNREKLHQQMLNWANRFNICCFLANHNYSSVLNFQEILLGAGSIKKLPFSEDSDLETINSFIDSQKDWVFFHLSFESLSILKKEIPLASDKTGFLPLTFFVPQYVIKFRSDNIEIGSLEMDHEDVFHQLIQESVTDSVNRKSVNTIPAISRETYLEKINGLLAHIQRGDCYEINFCQEFFSEHAVIDPLQTWRTLCTISPNPFSVFYKSESAYLLSASPERFLCKKGEKLISQPMKGTIRRDPENPQRDAALRHSLQHSQKDQMENVMVVDLVRNDLSRVCQEGTVKVSELFGIYAYPQVYQMISTIEGKVKKNISFMDIMDACFPMGSMTGAPKHRVLDLIRVFENGPRGLFSGSVGYITPEGDFDMNVVIRSILYNAATNYLSFMSGSGITALSNPENEYEECLLKGSAIRKVLS